MKRVPDHLDEADLLAIAEGRSHGVSNVHAVRAAIEADPALGRLLLEMRGDREELRAASAQITAPVGLLDGIEARLERDVLASLVPSTGSESVLPVSAVVYARPSVLGRLSESLSVRRFAVAAAVVLGTATIGLLVRNVVNSGGLAPKDGLGGGEVVDSTDGTPSGIDGTDIAGGAGPEVMPVVPEIGAGLGKGTDRVIALDTGPVESINGGSGSEPEKTAAPTMTLAKALELAGSGRLAIRVVSQRTTAGEEVRSVAARSPKEVRWKPLEESSSIVAVLAAKFAVPGRGVPTKQSPGETAVAGESEANRPARATGTNPASTAPNSVIPTGKGAYLVEFEGQESRLASIVAALARASSSDVVLVELDEPIGVSAGLDPASMLWWGRKPQDWVKRVAVPVMVDGGAAGHR